MKFGGGRLLASIVLVALALTGCGGSSNSVNLPAATLSDVSGDYVGTLKDNTAGTQTATRDVLRARKLRSAAHCCWARPARPASRSR